MRRRQCRGGCHIGSLASELSDLDLEARSDLAAAFQRWISAIRDGLQTMQDRESCEPMPTSPGSPAR